MRLIPIFFLYLITISVSAQEFFNLDFEYEAEEGQPRAWFVEGEDQFAVNLTSDDLHKGRKSLSVSVSGGQVVAYLSLPGALVAGQTIKISGFLKSIASEGLQVMVGFKDPAQSKPVVFPAEHQPAGQWLHINAEKTFESYTSDRLLIAMVVAGNGKVLLDDFSLTIGQTEVREGMPDLTEPGRSMLKALNQDALAIDTSGSIDSKVLVGLVGNSRIVALGENSHGSAPIYKIKLSIIQNLVKNAGFSIFALECPRNEATVVNKYVQGNDVSRQDVLKSLVYPAWKTQEMLTIIEWMRQYNRLNMQAIQFVGFDVVDKNGIDRDRVMADAIRDLAANSNNERIILSGDNTHITKATGKMGSYLREWFGADYLPIGFTFGVGTYAAYGPKNPYSVHHPYPGTLEYIFEKMEPTDFVLDIRKANIKTLFERQLGFRSIGSRPQETTQFAKISITTHFDVVVYLAKSSHTTFISD